MKERVARLRKNHRTGNTVAIIKTNREWRVGPQRLVLERCGKDGKSVLEITLDFEVRPNTIPRFERDIQLNFTVNGT